MSEIKIEAVDFHRNGVGGEGFMVAIAEHPEYGRMLVVDFGYDAETWNDDNWGHVAVLNLDQATAGNIYMHPANGQPGGNAWRGDVVGAGEIRPLMKAKYDAEHP